MSNMKSGGSIYSFFLGSDCDMNQCRLLPGIGVFSVRYGTVVWTCIFKVHTDGHVHPSTVIVLVSGGYPRIQLPFLAPVDS